MEKIVQNGQTEPKAKPLGNPKAYKGTSSGEVCAESGDNKKGSRKSKFATSYIKIFY